jgi:hypothetical protein
MKRQHLEAQRIDLGALPLSFRVRKADVQNAHSDRDLSGDDVRH